MNTLDIILNLAPAGLVFLFILLLFIRSLRRCYLTDWQMTALVPIWVVNLVIVVCFWGGLERYLGIAISVAFLGVNLVGLLFQVRKRRRA